MSAQPPLPMAPVAGAVSIGQAVALVQDTDGGRVFLRGELVYAWSVGDVALRRLAAVQLVANKAARVADVAAGFGVDPGTLWRWGRQLSATGVGGLLSDKRGPKGAHRLTPKVVADIIARRGAGASHRAIAAAVGVSYTSVRRVSKPATATSAPAADEGSEHDVGHDAGRDGDAADTTNDADPAGGTDPAGAQLPVLPPATDRCAERAAARWGQLTHADPVFAPAARVPLAGLLLAIPALEATGLLSCATAVFGRLRYGFYGLDTVLVEGVLRALAGEPRAEGATRVDPVALGRVLGLDRAPEVKTIRRKITALADTGRAGELLAGMAAAHVARLDKSNPHLLAVFYVDGHVRAYQGTAKVAKTHLSRLRFPAPATVETWVSDASGDPVLVVMAEPGASLAMELRRLLPNLRRAVGDDRRVLVGFDRGGWSPALFRHMYAQGFDVLTWRKGFAENVAPDLFTDLTYTDETGREHAWRVGDTTVDLPTGDKEQVFTMRQVTLIVANNKTGRAAHGQGSTRQIHILTTRADLPVAQVIYRMGSRWRQENYFRYARMHFDLDSHDAYATTDDDPTRLVPNPAKKKAHQQVLAARGRYDRALAATDTALLAARSPAPGEPVLITNTDHDGLTADLRAAGTDLDTAQAAHRGVPARLPLAQVNPGQQVLDVQTKLISHAIRIAAFNTATALARAIRVHTGYARANHEAHALVRQTLTGSGDIDPREGTLTVRLDPLPTGRATTAIAQLCEHLTATQTRYPGTDLVLRYEVKTRP
ncbi:MAG: putative transposase [Dermatophilaceae bacterium]